MSGSSNVKDVASALSHAVYDGQKVRLRAIGAGAVNQAVKACAVARGLVAPRGIDLYVKPGFVSVDLEEGERSAIILTVMAIS